MLDKNTAAAAAFWRVVHNFSQNVRAWDIGVIWHEIKPDEVLDPTLISRRVYGRPDEYLAVMAAAAMCNLDTPMLQKKIALPNEAQLLALKRRAGFESMAQLRENFAPVWEQ